jgi:hypothetical protein
LPPPVTPAQVTPAQVTPPPVTPVLGLALSGPGSDIVGGTHSVQAVAKSGTSPLAGAQLRWQVSGVNPATGMVTTASDGKATIAWPGAKSGDDTLTAYVDANGNGTRDPDEPQQTLAVHWLAPPMLGKTANVEPVSGTVLVKLPQGASARRWKLGPAQANGFIPLTEAKQLPLGSTLDTVNGRVVLQTAAAKGNSPKTQDGEFYSGVFTFGQTRGNKPITDLKMTGPLDCGKIKSAAAKKKATSRSLWGSDRGGSFRTRGRNSAATVRGTLWLTKDTCTTTTTVVSQGTVVVHDFAKGKDVTVKQGHSYVAHAKTAGKHG